MVRASPARGVLLCLAGRVGLRFGVSENQMGGWGEGSRTPAQQQTGADHVTLPGWGGLGCGIMGTARGKQPGSFNPAMHKLPSVIAEMKQGLISVGICCNQMKYGTVAVEKGMCQASPGQSRGQMTGRAVTAHPREPGLEGCAAVRAVLLG